MANVNKLERMQMEIDRTKNSIESQQNRLKELRERLGKEKDKEILRIVREQGLEPDQLERLLRAYHIRVNAAAQGKEVPHASDETQNGNPQ